jgi:hypothetical protein
MFPVVAVVLALAASLASTAAQGNASTPSPTILRLFSHSHLFRICALNRPNGSGDNVLELALSSRIPGNVRLFLTCFDNEVDFLRQTRLEEPEILWGDALASACIEEGGAYSPLLQVDGKNVEGTATTCRRPSLFACTPAVSRSSLGLHLSGFLRRGVRACASAEVAGLAATFWTLMPDAQLLDFDGIRVIGLARPAITSAMVASHYFGDFEASSRDAVGFFACTSPYPRPFILTHLPACPPLVISARAT